MQYGAEASLVVEMDTREDFLKMLDQGGIVSHFQPIVDLHFAKVFSYEVLSRGRPPFESSLEMFSRAEEWKLLWELECACHIAALTRISALPNALKAKHFFLNISPKVLTDPRFSEGFTYPCFNEMGLDPRQFHYPRVSVSAPISTMVLRPPCFENGSMTCEELDRFFNRNPSVDHVMVLKNGTSGGLITKRHFSALAGGRFGFHLIQRKPIDIATKPNTLTFEPDVDITVLSRLAMDREQDDLYDPVVIVDRQGGFMGTITMKQLLTQSIRIEVQRAADANPLTGLPGNAIIQSWLQDALQSGSFSIIYGDLDHFKCYNDSYGFPRGDEMIKIAARILAENAPKISMDAKLGHVGGDDFVIVCTTPITEQALAGICEQFDRDKRKLFNVADLERGSYRSTDRQGRTADVPLVTLSLAAVTSDNLGPTPYLGQFGEIAAALKKQIKKTNTKTGKSGYLLDRRRFRDTPACFA